MKAQHLRPRPQPAEPGAEVASIEELTAKDLKAVRSFTQACFGRLSQWRKDLHSLFRPESLRVAFFLLETQLNMAQPEAKVMKESSWLAERMAEVQDVVMRQVTWCVETTKSLTDSVQQKVQMKVQEVVKSLQGGLDMAKAKASQAHVKAKEVVQDHHVQATAVGVVGGGVLVGASGGATGLAAGTMAGAAVGVLPAIFTFGLSIPVGACIGAGAGLAVGAGVGASLGSAAGGAAGYQAYAKREQIGAMRQKTVRKVTESIDTVKGKAMASAQFLKDKASEARQRLGRKA